MNSWFERQFKLSEHGTDVRKEIMAGITTFVTMAYIIFVNPGILSETGMPFGSVLVATCLGASLATFLMAFLANYPFALAPGMGLNAFFAFTVVLGMGIPWQVALAAVFVEGVIFIVLTCTKVREEVVNSIPKTLKIGVSAGIGLFITFIGLQGSGIVVDNPAVLLGLGKLSGNIPALLSILGLLLMVTLEARRVKGGILIGVVVVTALAIPLGVAKMPEGIVSMPPSLSPIFMKMDFSMLAQPAFWSVTLAFFFVDFFDTPVGTLVGVSSRANMLDEKGRLPKASQALMSDAIGTTAGAVLGTSTVTTFVESASGVEQGGRTGLTALTVAVLIPACDVLQPDNLDSPRLRDRSGAHHGRRLHDDGLQGDGVHRLDGILPRAHRLLHDALRLQHRGRHRVRRPLLCRAPRCSWAAVKRSTGCSTALPSSSYSTGRSCKESALWASASTTSTSTSLI